MNHIDTRGEKLREIVAADPFRTRATGFRFTKGPVWHGADQVPLFSDIPGDCMCRFDPASERFEVYRSPRNKTKTNGNVFDHQHWLLSCEHATSHVARLEVFCSMTVVASHYEGIELNSPNDIVIAVSCGNFIWGDADRWTICFCCTSSVYCRTLVSGPYTW